MKQHGWLHRARMASMDVEQGREPAKRYRQGQRGSAAVPPPRVQRQVIIFDADDTLWFTAPSYAAVLDECQAIIESAGLSGAAWRELHVKNDVALTATMHLSRAQFPLAARRAAIELMNQSGKNAPPDLADRVEACAKTVFEKPLPLLPGVEAALASLRRQGHHLVLLTKGDHGVQEPRIIKSGLGPHFHQISIVSEKSAKIFAQIARRAGVSPGECWSVGNSLPSDINPALSAGMKAIWIDAEVWAYERREREPVAGCLLRANRITELPVLFGARVLPVGQISKVRGLAL